MVCHGEISLAFDLDFWRRYQPVRKATTLDRSAAVALFSSVPPPPRGSPRTSTSAAATNRRARRETTLDADALVSPRQEAHSSLATRTRAPANLTPPASEERAERARFDSVCPSPWSAAACSAAPGARARRSGRTMSRRRTSVPATFPLGAGASGTPARALARRRSRAAARVTAAATASACPTSGSRLRRRSRSPPRWPRRRKSSPRRTWTPRRRSRPRRWRSAPPTTSAWLRARDRPRRSGSSSCELRVPRRIRSPPPPCWRRRTPWRTSRASRVSSRCSRRRASRVASEARCRRSPRCRNSFATLSSRPIASFVTSPSSPSRRPPRAPTSASACCTGTSRISSSAPTRGSSTRSTR